MACRLLLYCLWFGCGSKVGLIFLRWLGRGGCGLVLGFLMCEANAIVFW